jgi:4-hydroxybenzoyl-CoA thioesterase
MQIGDLVELEARLLHTGDQTMHVSIHVRSGDPRTAEKQLTTHCLTVVTPLDDNGRPTAVRPWLPETDEDRRLDKHAVELASVRTRLDGSPLFGRASEAPV